MAKRIELPNDIESLKRLVIEQSAALEPNQPHYRGIESNPSLIMLKRVAYMKTHPPAANWDGVYVMKEK